MADIKMTYEQPIEQFWAMTDEVKAGMLGVEGSGQHMQPMHPFLEREGRNLWFFVRSDSDIVASVGDGARAHFCVIGRDHDYYACVAGHMSARRDPHMIDRFWSSVSSAWFSGKDDPKLTMLCLELEDGVAWSSVGSVRFGWEILKANMTAGDPDVGARKHFSFVHAPHHEPHHEPQHASQHAGDGGGRSGLAAHVPRQEGQV